MTTSESMTIGAFARATGLTPGALRFYADSGLLSPARIDESTGYRYYSHDQIERASVVRRLRDIDMPLEKIALVLTGELAHIDRHVTDLLDRAQKARRSAADVRASFRTDGNNTDRNNNTDRKSTMIAVNGPVFADAVEQILTATAYHPDHPVLGGVYVEASGDSLTLTATNRLRLSTRTVVVAQSVPDPWNIVVDGGDLRTVMQEVRQQHRVDVSVDNSGIVFHPGDRHCRTLKEQFPDYRIMLDSLPEATTRVVVSRTALLRAIEDRQSAHLTFTSRSNMVRISAPKDPEFSEIAAAVTGPEIEIAFAMTTIYPAIASAVGSEVIIDIIDRSMPVVIRSADSGDLTTVAMPVDPSGLT